MRACPYSKRFLELVDMSPSQIRAWARDPRSRLASWQETRDRLPALARLRGKAPSRWTDEDCAFARRVVSFNSRMIGMAGQWGCTTKIAVSLRNWGNASCPLKAPRPRR